MTGMTESAQVILTGYEMPKIEESVSTLKKYFKSVNIVLETDPDLSKTIKSKSKLWGCESNNAKQRVLFVNGALDDLQKLIDVTPADGVYFQLLLE